MSDPNWTFICATGELLPGEFRGGADEVTGAGIIVFNLDGDLYALEDKCTHRDFALSKGGPSCFVAEDGTMECVLHGALFNVRDGSPANDMAFEPVAKFPVKVEHGGVWSRDDRA